MTKKAPNYRRHKIFPLFQLSNSRVYLNVNYTSPLLPGDNLVICARVSHLGKRMINVTQEARAESDGRMIATAMVGYMAIDHVDKKC